jgi:hypothetical protein
MDANVRLEIYSIDAVAFHVKGKSAAGGIFSQNSLDRFSLLKCCSVSSSRCSSPWARL